MPDQTFHYAFLGVLIALVVFIFVLFTYYLYKQESKFKKVFNYQAKKRDGEIVSGSVFSVEKLFFNHNGNEIKIFGSVGKTSGDTYIDIKLKNPTNQTVKINKKICSLKIGKTLHFDNYEFNEKIVVSSSDEGFIKRFLSLEIQNDILRNLEECNLSIKLRNDFLRIWHYDILENIEKSDIIIDFSLRLVDRLNEITKK